MVRFKEEVMNTNYIDDPSFNSWMVRFKVKKGGQMSNDWYEVSIPEWFDLKDILRICQLKYLVVSIPEWFDLKYS